jgi:hypothetical protein
MARKLILISLGSLVALVAACGRDAPAKPASTPSRATAEPALASKAFYRVDGAPQAACASGATCEARLRLTALGDYHVNKEYPFKFVADPAAVAVDGVGQFALDGEKQGTMTIKFRPTAPGTAKLVGTFKLSVCSAETCEIESPKVELAIPVT